MPLLLTARRIYILTPQSPLFSSTLWAINAVGHKRQPSRLVDGINELLLFGRWLFLPAIWAGGLAGYEPDEFVKFDGDDDCYANLE